MGGAAAYGLQLIVEQKENRDRMDNCPLEGKAGFEPTPSRCAAGHIRMCFLPG